MRQTRAVSVLALAGALLGLSSAPACGRETFDLLETRQSAQVGGASGTSAVVGGAGSAGGTLDPDAGTGGFANAASAGSGEGGASGACAGGAGCANNMQACAPSAPFCTPCTRRLDCSADAQAPRCDVNLGRCVGCTNDSECLAKGEKCSRLTYRCAKTCMTSSDCAADSSHLVCDVSLGVCVGCATAEDCAMYPHGGKLCNRTVDACVECIDNHHCTNGSCVAGRCQQHH